MPTMSIGESLLIAPFLDLLPESAVAENWPLVNPYTPLFSTIQTIFTCRRIACTNWPMPMDAESPSPDTPRYNNSRLARLAPVNTDGMRPCTVLNPCEADRK